MPADAAQSVRRGGLLSVGSLPLDQRQPGGLRVGEDREAADVGNVGRRDVHGAAEAHDLVGGGVHVVDQDISEPARVSARSTRVLRQIHQAAYQGVPGGKHHIRPARRRSVQHPPSHDPGVKGCGRRHVRGGQLVPGESTVNIDHVCCSRARLRASRGPCGRAPAASDLVAGLSVMPKARLRLRKPARLDGALGNDPDPRHRLGRLASKNKDLADIDKRL